MKKKKQSEIIATAHTKGGVGKSTLAWHLAHSFLDINKSVTLVDLDFQQTLYFIHSIGQRQDLEVLQPQSVEELLNLVVHEPLTDIVIIDVGGFDNDINRTAIDIAHKVLIPISNSVTEVLGFKTFEAILEDCNILGEKEINVVLNNIHPATKKFDIIKKAVGDQYKILNTVVRNRKVYRETMGNGNSIYSSFYPVAQAEISGVRDELRRSN